MDRIGLALLLLVCSYELRQWLTWFGGVAVARSVGRWVAGQFHKLHWRER
jgi:hypothetical protein